MKVTAKEIEEAVQNNPDMDIKVLAKKLGIRVNRIYSAKYRIKNRAKEEERRKEYMRPVDTSPKAVPIITRVCGKDNKYYDYKGYDVSAFWGL